MILSISLPVMEEAPPDSVHGATKDARIRDLIGVKFRFHVPLSAAMLRKLRSQASAAKSGPKAKGPTKNSTKGQEAKGNTRTKKALSLAAAGSTSLDKFLNISSAETVERTMEQREPGTYVDPRGGFFAVNSDGSISPLDEQLFFHPTLQRVVFYKDQKFYHGAAPSEDGKAIFFDEDHLARNGARLLEAPPSYFPGHTEAECTAEEYGAW